MSTGAFGGGDCAVLNFSTLLVVQTTVSSQRVVAVTWNGVVGLRGAGSSLRSHRAVNRTPRGGWVDSVRRVQHIDDDALLGAGVVAFEMHAYSPRSGATSSMKAAFSAAGLNSTIKQPVSVKTRSWPGGMW